MHAVDPAQERLGLRQGAEIDEGARGHRGVAQPAVPVVPVAHAAELLGERRRRGREDRAGRLRGRALGASARSAAPPSCAVAGSRRLAAQSAPRLLGARLPVVDRVRVGLHVLGVEAQLDRRPALLPPRGRRPRGRVSWPPSSKTSHSTPGAYSTIGSLRAEHEQPVAEWLQPDRHLAELGPRRELQPRRRPCP